MVCNLDLVVKRLEHIWYRRYINVVIIVIIIIIIIIDKRSVLSGSVYFQCGVNGHSGHSLNLT